MLVDLGRNDLGKNQPVRNREGGKVPCPIERFSHVMHIGSTVRGQIREDKDAAGCRGCDAAGRDPFRCAEAPGLPDHRRAGEQQAGHLRRSHRLSGFYRQSGHLHRHPAGIKKERKGLSSGPAPGSWPTACRKKNIEECCQQGQGCDRRPSGKRRGGIEE